MRKIVKFAAIVLGIVIVATTGRITIVKYNAPSITKEFTDHIQVTSSSGSSLFQSTVVESSLDDDTIAEIMESYSTPDAETMEELFASFANTYSEDVVAACRERFGDEEALDRLSHMERAPFNKRVYPGMESVKESGNERKVDYSAMTDEEMKAQFDTFTTMYGEKVVKAIREDAGDRLAVIMLNDLQLD